MNLRYSAKQFQAQLSTLVLVFLFPLSSVLNLRSSPASSPARAGAQARITLATVLVVVPVKVTDARGKFVTGLKAENFKIYEDGRPQDVTLFKEEDTPVTVGLIVDHSRSMGPKLPGVITAVTAFAHSSNPGDEMFVVDFNENVSGELLGGKPFTSDAAELEKAVSAVSARGQTALYDAVIEGLTHVELGHQDKKALVIVSDGGDNASHSKFSEMLALAQRSHVVIYSIGLIDESGEEETPKILERLSKATGGITFFARRNDDVAEISQQIARDLREQYTLGYKPTEKNGRDSFRKIAVEVSAPGRGKIHVRTRPGYFPSGVKTQAALPVGILR
ncbi:MAG TPA: VWA domain-containing protein [Candidatus Acidoferrum sp.]|nr:VWA domain-containing protein [Candidatus Acidoferrum sp.]